jgi:hypothetical protein
VSEVLRQQYPHAFIMNVVVWPYDFGEVCVQHYNSVLTLSHLALVSDMVLVLENEVATHVCRRLLHIPAPSYRDLNTVIVRHLCMLLLPSVLDDDTTPTLSFPRLSDPLLTALTSLCSHPVRLWRYVSALRFAALACCRRPPCPHHLLSHAVFPGIPSGYHENAANGTCSVHVFVVPAATLCLPFMIIVLVVSLCRSMRFRCLLQASHSAHTHGPVSSSTFDRWVVSP